jgi:Growth arrest and DNA-damage-inducible proteins-interacting protein 1
MRYASRSVALRSFSLNDKYFSSLPKTDSNADIVRTVVTQGDVNDDDELSSLRDISRMPKQYRDRMKHVMNPPEQPDYVIEMHRSLDLRRRLYAKYGRRSGQDPGLMWPSESELADLIEFEKEWEPTLQQMIAKSKEERRVEEKAKQEK